MATSENQPKAAPDKSAADAQKTSTSTTGGTDKARETAANRRTETAARTATGDRVRSQRSGNRDEDPNGGLADEARENFERRTTVPGADNVDARLDNRAGRQRPKLEEWPAKPQQIDGPDVMTQAEFTRAFLQGREDGDVGDRKGMFSPGPHGLSDESLREGGPVGETETLYGTESLTEDELKASQADGPKADG